MEKKVSLHIIPNVNKNITVWLCNRNKKLKKAFRKIRM
jgi:hypothetical protein